MKKKIGVLITALLLICLGATICACNTNIQSLTLACRDATAQGFNISMEVDNSTTNIDLSKKIITRFGVTWQAYADESCTYPCNPIVYLKNGENVIYIEATFSGKRVGIYTLTIYRHFTAEITFFANDEIYYTDYARTNMIYIISSSFVPQTDGLIFECWTDENGEEVRYFTPRKDTNLFAKFKSLTYKAALSDGAIIINEIQIDFQAV